MDETQRKLLLKHIASLEERLADCVRALHNKPEEDVWWAMDAVDAAYHGLLRTRRMARRGK